MFKMHTKMWHVRLLKIYNVCTLKRLGCNGIHYSLFKCICILTSRQLHILQVRLVCILSIFCIINTNIMYIGIAYMFIADSRDMSVKYG